MNFHQKDEYLSKVNNRFSTKWWNPIKGMKFHQTYETSYWLVFICKVNFRQSDDFPSKRWVRGNEFSSKWKVFIDVKHFHRSILFLIQRRIFIKIISFHLCDKFTTKWEIYINVIHLYMIFHQNDNSYQSDELDQHDDSLSKSCVFITGTNYITVNDFYQRLPLHQSDDILS